MTPLRESRAIPKAALKRAAPPTPPAPTEATWVYANFQDHFTAAAALGSIRALR
jgi:hypothetical protein